MIPVSPGARALASSSRRISTRAKRASAKITQSPDEKPKLCAKKLRTSKSAEVTRASRSVWGKGKGRFSKCTKCGVIYRMMCLDPNGNEMPDRDWFCGACSRSENMSHAVSSVPAPRPPTLQPVSKANSHPPLPLPSLSGDMINVIDDPTITPTFSDAEKDPENRRIADDPSVARMFKSSSVGVVEGTENVMAVESPAVTLATKGERHGPWRRGGGMRRAVLGAGNGNRPLWGSMKPSCYCGKTDDEKPTARCVYCGSVFHPQCMEPPYPTVHSLPLVGYTCLTCRPACGICGVGVSSESSLNITCAECKLEFHRACISPPLSGPGKGWKCCECMLTPKHSKDADEAHPVEVEEHAAPFSGLLIPEDGRRSKTGGQAESAPMKPMTMPRALDKAVKGKHACVVCNVAEGRRMNMCGSCGDAYHSMCLSRSRTRRSGDSWRCDRCRTSAPVVRPPSVRPPRIPAPKRGCTPTTRSNAHLLAGCAVPDGRHAASVTSGGHEGSKGGGVNVAVKERPCAPEAESTGRWTKDEHSRFLKGVAKHSRRWQLVADEVRTRTAAQCRSHAQKHFQKILNARRQK